MFGSGPRQMQDRFDTRRLADRLVERAAASGLLDRKDFIESVPFFFLATADADGRPQCSYKGGAPGFVRVLSDTELCFPNYDGNGMYLSTGNMLENPHVGLLFIDFSAPRRLRVNGTAEIDDALGAQWPGAQFGIRVTATDVFPNCPRYVHDVEVGALSEYVPAPDGSAPEPAWKRSDWAKDVLPSRK